MWMRTKNRQNTAALTPNPPPPPGEGDLMVEIFAACAFLYIRCHQGAVDLLNIQQT